MNQKADPSCAGCRQLLRVVENAVWWCGALGSVSASAIGAWPCDARAPLRAAVDFSQLPYFALTTASAAAASALYLSSVSHRRARTWSPYGVDWGDLVDQRVDIRVAAREQALAPPALVHPSRAVERFTDASHVASSGLPSIARISKSVASLNHSADLSRRHD